MPPNAQQRTLQFHQHTDSAQPKKRRTDRACDACRRKKTRCDGPWAPNNICSNCAQTKKPCTYLEASKPRGPPKAYVVGLEDRVEELETLLAQIKPGVDFSDELGPPVVRGSWKDSDDQPSTTAPGDFDNAASGSGTRSASSSKQSPASGSPVMTLPPIMIPFHQSDAPGHFSAPARTTHLLFKTHSKVKRKTQKRSSLTASTVSSGSGTPSTSQTAGSEYRSPSPFASSSESEASGDENSESDSEDLIETSLGGRNRLNLTMNRGPAGMSNIVFHGRNSTARLVEEARRFKFLHMQETMKMDVEKQGDPDNEEVSSTGSKAKLEGPDNSRVAMTRRPQFWQPLRVGLTFSSCADI